MSMKALFGQLAVHLAEGKWQTPDQLAQALSDFFNSDAPIELAGPLQLKRDRDFPPIKVVDEENFFETGIQFTNRGDKLSQFGPNSWDFTKVIHQHPDDSVAASRQNIAQQVVFYPAVTKTPLIVRQPVSDAEISDPLKRSRNWSIGIDGSEPSPNESGGGLGVTGGLLGAGSGSGSGTATVVSAITGVTVNSDCSVTVNYSTTEIGDAGSVAVTPGVAGAGGPDIFLLMGC
jgi:hypothetical protein